MASILAMDEISSSSLRRISLTPWVARPITRSSPTAMRMSFLC
jgi:hypothetical protein